jgi:rfaE bifunctional protein nucleotidyltransferase chain/domain
MGYGLWVAMGYGLFISYETHSFSASCRFGPAPEVSGCLGFCRQSCRGDMHLLSSIVAMSVQKIKTLDEIVRLRPGLRESGKKLVFTNGCFDILHAGHVRYLNHARSLGDALVVAVNSDHSVRKIKGESRPIVPEQERAEVLAALACVDFVFIFDDPTPKHVIDAIVPDVLIKGADWNIDEIVGRDTVEKAGGIVLNVPLVEGSSTSDIIKRVLERFGTADC